ncbi:NAD(P)-binding protein [Xylariaceae sp. FL0594]|nr:NAD(P)-binding protein [Xylariaceae sp. FL0594]
MPAWIYTGGSPDPSKALTLVHDARRPPSDPLPSDRALVRVTYASLNPADYKLREMGRVANYMISRFASGSPGMDFAGVIEALPPSSSTEFKIGDKVFGRIMSGALGTYITPPLSSIVHIPATLSPLDASTLATAAGTAYEALVPYVTKGAGDRVFVNGGSGGVGSFAIQIAARVLGCRVTASCSAKNVELCKSLGAEDVIDYTSSPTAVFDGLRAKGKVFKLVIDNVPSSPSSKNLFEEADSYMLPSPSSFYIQVGGGFSLPDMSLLARRTLPPLPFFGAKKPAGVKFKFLLLKQEKRELVDLGQWMAEGKIRAVLDGDHVYDFADVPKAFERLKTGRTRGKIVVKVSDE